MNGHPHPKHHLWAALGIMKDLREQAKALLQAIQEGDEVKGWRHLDEIDRLRAALDVEEAKRIPEDVPLEFIEQMAKEFRAYAESAEDLAEQMADLVERRWKERDR